MSTLIHNMWNCYDGIDIKMKESLRFVASDLARNKLKFTVYDFLALDWTLLYMVRLTGKFYTFSSINEIHTFTDNRSCKLIHDHNVAISFCN